jgi:NAD(P)-dependent dehydrogenase (short-subunit alcohol dehydrogenase family)
MPTFPGTVALVTGAARGIGAATSTCLAEYGAAVAVTDADFDAAEALAESLVARGLNAKPYRYDVTNWDDATSVVDRVEAELGPIGILVNNAGVSKFVGFLDLDEAEWDRVLDINLKGTFVTTRAVLPGMVARGAGRVVNMASICGKLGYAQFSHYSTSKFGIIGLTQALAAEMAPHGITVNAVCPGIVETPLKGQLIQDMIAGPSDITSEEEALAWFKSYIPLGRPQPPEDIAEMVAFIASEHGRNMTGGSYHVDGGITPR